MSRTIEPIDNEISLVTEETGEQWKSQYERGLPEPGHCLFQNVVYPILTQDKIDTVYLLPHFDVDRYTEQPEDHEQLFGYLKNVETGYGLSILERVARIRIAENLKLKSIEV